MSFSAIWTRRLKYMLTPQFDLYKRIGEQYGDDLILDYGCGIGFGTLQLRRDDLLSGYEPCDFIPHKVFGVDCDEDAIEFAREVGGQFATFSCADALGIDTSLWTEFKKNAIGADGSFDLVTLIEVVEHMSKESQEILVGALADTMHPGSTLILSTPNKHSQWRKHSGHIGVHDPASLRALLSPHFADVALEDYLGEPVADDTTVSPLVAVARNPK